MKQLSDDRLRTAIKRGGAPTLIADTQLSVAGRAANGPFRGGNTPAGGIFDETARRQFVRDCKLEGLAKGG